MKKAIIIASIAGALTSGLILYFIRKNRNKKYDSFTSGKNTFKYIGERTHNSLHEIL
jgi:hypothetical protein